MKQLRTLAPILAGIIVFTTVFVISQNSFAVTIYDGVNAAHGTGQPTALFGAGGVVNTVTNILLFIVGALSVVMLIVGGIRYAVSGGNAAAVTAAKNTILYAIVGLVVAFLAYAAVNFVLNALTPGASSGFTNV